MEFIDLEEKQISSESVFHGVIMDVYRDEIMLPNRQKGIREIMRHVGAVCVIPINEKNEVLIETQYRYAVGKALYEIPAGKLNTKKEDRLQAAKRELREETGITAANWVSLGDFLPAPAYSDERITMFLARELSYGETELDPDEFLTVEWVSMETLLSMVLEGKIEDEKTQLAILKAKMYIENEKE